MVEERHNATGPWQGRRGPVPPWLYGVYVSLAAWAMWYLLSAPARP
ncbi:MAG: hypothetical protein IRY95_00760 [Clostridia bacterium]|nr:hypothetical protein [Clostridia bacterium]